MYRDDRPEGSREKRGKLPAAGLNGVSVMFRGRMPETTKVRFVWNCHRYRSEILTRTRQFQSNSGSLTN